MIKMEHVDTMENALVHNSVIPRMEKCHKSY
jgi:hypothetical protein